MSDQAEKYPELLADLVEQLAEQLQRRGIDQAAAVDVARAAAEFMREHWGGHNIYIPKAKQFILSQRDMEIWRRYNGRNVFTLCREFGISEQRLYQIVHAAREMEVQRRQGKLF